MTFHYDNTEPNKKLTILCLDDDFIVLKLMERDLKNLFDINLITSRSSMDVLNYLENNTVDMIIQDVIRPEIDGWEFLKIIRMKDKLKDLPVLFLTTMTLDAKFIEEAEKLDAGYLSKPSHSQQLKVKVIEVLPSITLS